METLVAVAQQDQFHGRNRGRKIGSFGSYHTREFREINCRAFGSFGGSGGGLLPVPSNSSPNSTKRQYANVNVANVKKHVFTEQNGKDNNKRIVKSVKSSSVPIPLDVKIKRVSSSVKSKLRDSFNDSFFYSELWAGPAYSNSPPPSSLPIPKFSIKPKRTVSLELSSVSGSEIDLLALAAKSAPASPTREHNKVSRRDFFNSDDDDATKTLRRILNLDE